jgi:hypothetical protein
MPVSLRNLSTNLAFLTLIVVLNSCNPGLPENADAIGRLPSIQPDYLNVTIPPNVAPMNFFIGENARKFIVSVKVEGGENELVLESADGSVCFPEKKWKKTLEKAKGKKLEISVYANDRKEGGYSAYDTFNMYVSEDKIDPYIAYRLIHPGYYSWSNIRIKQRSVESFKEESIFENQVMEKNCANCHSFNNASPDRFMIHIRGSLGGTYFVENKEITKVDPKIDAMPGGATYPVWHPGGRFLSYSSNQVRQAFYSVPSKVIEVFDLVSSVILYDRINNETFTITGSDTIKYLETFPSWSPDGNYLYYCRARQVINTEEPELEQIMNTRYDLVRRQFNEEKRTFGDAELVFDASGKGKSASFPRISPDGRYLVFTLHDYGTFPIWHREADLWILDLERGTAEKMTINSTETESYHTWSTNGRWMVFSSKRIDGRSARPHFVHIGADGKQSKEFVLPQKDPLHYDTMLESFNIPEFVTGKIKIGPRDLAKASGKPVSPAKPGVSADSLPAIKAPGLKVKETDRPIHQ